MVLLGIEDPKQTGYAFSVVHKVVCAGTVGTKVAMLFWQT